MTLFRKTHPKLRMAEDSNHESWKDWFQLNGPKLLLCARPQVELREDSQPARRVRVL
jgi:hypothetical protein